MNALPTDVFISGGGIAGLTAAAAFAQAGFSVCLADPAPPARTAASDGSDLRSTAYLQPARALFVRTGLWDALKGEAMPLDVLRIIETVGWPPEIRETREFRSDDLSDQPFGWNLPNWLTRNVLIDAVAKLDGVDLRLGTAFSGLLQREGEAFVTLSDRTRLVARLVVAADGHRSPLREAARIGTDIRRYSQKALAFAVTHPEPHMNVSTEIYNQGGAFTLVPMQDNEGSPASAVVWMCDGARAVELMSMDEAAFNTAMTERSCAIHGPLRLASARRSWPIVTQTARTLTARRVALIAEAAHVLPPIGAQGLNTSLRDVSALVEIARKTPGRLGDDAMLADYEASRTRDVHVRAMVIDLYNRICRSGEAPIQGLRLMGLRTVHGVAPLRRAVMRAGLGSPPEA